MYIVIKKTLTKEFENKLFEFISSFGSLRKFSIHMNYSPTYVSAIVNGKKPMSKKFYDKLLKIGFDINKK